MTPFELFQKHKTGRTCLHFAASKSNLDLVEFLCEHGANPQAKSNFVGFFQDFPISGRG